MLKKMLLLSAGILCLTSLPLQAQEQEAQNYLLPEMQDRLTYLEEQVQTMRGEIERLNHELNKAPQQTIKVETKSSEGLSKSGSQTSLEPEANGRKESFSKETLSPEEEALTQADLNSKKAREHQEKKHKKNELIDDKINDLSDENNSYFPNEEAQSDYEEAMELLAAEKYKEAEISFKDFIKNHPSNPLIVNAQYWIGETYFLRKKYKEASIHFADAYKKYTDFAKAKKLKTKEANTIGFTKAPEALVKLAFSLKGLGQNEDACVALDQLKIKFPHLPTNVKKLADRARKGLTCKKE